MFISEPESTATARHFTSVICVFVELVKMYSKSYPGRHIPKEKNWEKVGGKKEEEEEIGR